MTLDLRFLPWYRRGLSTLITAEDDELAPAYFSATAETWLAGSGEPVETDVAMFGPGDVEGIGEDQIVVREPAPGTTDFEPSYFAHVEFAAADLPWRFSPIQADGEDKLRPWLVLVVLRRTETLRIGKSGEAPAPFIHAPIAELHELIGERVDSRLRELGETS